MSTYVEDALKTTRNFHRLVITVSLVSLVFALSLSLPTNLVEAKKQINELRAVKFAEYETFSQQAVTDFYKPHAEEIHNVLSAFFEENDWLIFQTDAIADGLSSPVHVGKILIKDSILIKIDNTAINQLNIINSALDTNQNIQVFIPDISSLLDEIKTYLEENARTGARIDTVQVSIDEYSFAADTFLTGEDVYAYLYFELASDGPFEARPVFNTSLRAIKHEIPGSSLLNWLESEAKSETAYVVNNGKVDFLPDLPKLSDGYNEEKIGIVLKDINKEISKGSPSSQTVSILGTNVPGVLAIYATPLILVALMYYFSQHTGHLLTLVKNNEQSFSQFAWLPLILSRNWLFETVVSIIILPITSITWLNMKIFQFESKIGWEEFLSFSCSFAILLFAIVIIKNLKQVRLQLNNLEKPKSTPSPQSVS